MNNIQNRHKLIKTVLKCHTSNNKVPKTLNSQQLTFKKSTKASNLPRQTQLKQRTTNFGKKRMLLVNCLFENTVGGARTFVFGVFQLL
jgi:hypothetical protein